MAEKICPLAKKCGGCDYQGISYEEQLKKKENSVRKLMKEFGEIRPIIGADDPYHYRNKVQSFPENGTARLSQVSIRKVPTK